MTAPAIDRAAAFGRWSAPFAWWHEVVLFALLLGLMVYAAVFDRVSGGTPFVSLATQLDLSSQMWELALVALPMTMIIITAGIDLSVGGTVALAAVVLGVCCDPHGAHLPLAAGIALALLSGLAAGALNGLFIAALRVHPLIVTLATMFAYRGVAIAISKGAVWSSFPAGFFGFAEQPVTGITAPGFVVIAGTVLSAIVLGFTPVGRALYAMGYNPTAARFSGIPTGAIRFVLYTISGLVSAGAAIIYVSRFRTAKADLGSGLELQVITAVVLGGVSIFGGRGTIVGVALGVLLIHEVQQLIPWQTNNSDLNSLVIGGLLIGAVLINSVLAPKQR